MNEMNEFDLALVNNICEAIEDAKYKAKQAIAVTKNVSVENALSSTIQRLNDLLSYDLKDHLDHPNDY